MQENELIIDALDWKVIYHNEAREYIKSVGGFEKFAEWGSF